MVVVHPEYALLVLEINNLKDEIASSIVEKDMLSNYICKDLEIEYMLKIGSLEYKLVVAENKYDKMLKKLEIIEDKLAKNKDIDMAKINKKIDNLFKKQTKVEKNMSDAIDFSIEMSSIELFDYDLLDEMNVDYFKIQKLYNPIFDLEITEEKKKNYEKIEKYYKKGNYKRIHKLAKDYNENDIFQDEIRNMKNLKNKYIKILQDNKKDIRRIKNSFPYNQKTILEDENLYRRKKDSINRKIADINIKTSKIEKKIDNRLKNL